MHQAFTGSKRLDPLAQHLGHGLPGQCRGGGKLLRAEHRRVGHHDVKAEDRDQRSHENAGELGEELLARIGAEQVAALQVGQQVGRRSWRRPAVMFALIRVTLHVARAEQPEDELRDLAHGADRRGVGLAGHAAGHQGEQEGERDGDGALPLGHVEGRVGQPRQGDQRNELPGNEPGRRRFDGVHSRLVTRLLRRARTACADWRLLGACFAIAWRTRTGRK